MFLYACLINSCGLFLASRPFGFATPDLCHTFAPSLCPFAPFVSFHMVAGNQTQLTWKSSQCSEPWATSPAPPSSHCFFVTPRSISVDSLQCVSSDLFYVLFAAQLLSCKYPLIHSFTYSFSKHLRTIKTYHFLLLRSLLFLLAAARTKVSLPILVWESLTSQLRSHSSLSLFLEQLTSGCGGTQL